MQLEQLIEEAKRLPVVNLAAITEYQGKMAELIRHVDGRLAAIPDIAALIGNNPLQVMYDNHRHHAHFMVTVFSIGNYELLARTIPWVYRAYGNHHFRSAYFKLELNGWLEAIDRHCRGMMTEVVAIYRWMLDRHEAFVAIAQADVELQLPISEKWLPLKNGFLAALLDGDHYECLRISSEVVASGKDIQDFYLQIIQPAMYEIGMLWERGSISVAQEHLASAIVGRVMATVSMVEGGRREPKGRAVITAAPNEFHEIGAWMVSDLLEQQGWQVKYLGANTPAADLLDLLRTFKPEALLLSVTIPFNIIKAKEVIGAIRAEQELRVLRIAVGGQAFSAAENLWRDTGADGYAVNAIDAVELLGGWLNHG